MILDVSQEYLNDMSKYEYVQYMFNIIKDKYLYELNNSKTRHMFRNELSNLLGSDFIIKCDEENNTSEIIDSNSFICHVIYEDIFDKKCIEIIVN